MFPELQLEFVYIYIFISIYIFYTFLKAVKLNIYDFPYFVLLMPFRVCANGLQYSYDVDFLETIVLMLAGDTKRTFQNLRGLRSLLQSAYNFM